MKHFYLLFLMLLFTMPVASLAGPIDKVADLVKQGNIHELAAYFADNVELTILGQEDVYPKAQAESILNNFFSENRPRKVAILHKVNSNPKYLFCVLIVNSDNGGTFRVAYTLKADGAYFKLIEMRIENGKS